MSEWQPAETEPMDGNMVELKFANGQTCFAPSSPRKPLNHMERLRMAKDGEWPDHKAWRITHWRPASEQNSVGQLSTGDGK